MIICVKLFSVTVTKDQSKINSKGSGVILAHDFKGSHARLATFITLGARGREVGRIARQG